MGRGWGQAERKAILRALPGVPAFLSSLLILGLPQRTGKLWQPQAGLGPLPNYWKKLGIEIPPHFPSSLDPVSPEKLGGL